MGHILLDPFLIGILLGFTKRGEQVIFLYTRYVSGKQPFIRIVSLHCPFSLNAISFMKASTFECLVRYFLTSSLPMSTMKANGRKRGCQPMSSPQAVGLFLTVSISYFLPHQYIYIYIYQMYLELKEEQILTSTPLNVFLLDVNFDKSTIRFVGLK